MNTRQLAEVEAIPVERPVLNEEEKSFMDSRAGELNYIVDGIQESALRGDFFNLTAFAALMCTYSFRLGQEYARRENG